MSVLRSLIASHKTVYGSIAASVLSAMLTAIVTQGAAGAINWKAVGLAGLTVIATTLGGYAKSPATPKSDPPVPDSGGSPQ